MALLYEGYRLFWGYTNLNAYGDSKFWSAIYGIMRKSPALPVSGEDEANAEKRQLQYRQSARVSACKPLCAEVKVKLKQAIQENTEVDTLKAAQYTVVQWMDV